MNNGLLPAPDKSFALAAGAHDFSAFYDVPTGVFKFAVMTIDGVSYLAFRTGPIAAPWRIELSPNVLYVFTIPPAVIGFNVAGFTVYAYLPGAVY
jgi:hypothetical protein